jgi:hypothetical protein
MIDFFHYREREKERPLTPGPSLAKGTPRLPCQPVGIAKALSERLSERVQFCQGNICLKAASKHFGVRQITQCWLRAGPSIAGMTGWKQLGGECIHQA